MSSKKKSLKKKGKRKNYNERIHSESELRPTFFFKKIIIESLFYDCMTKCLKRKNKFDDTK